MTRSPGDGPTPAPALREAVRSAPETVDPADVVDHLVLGNQERRRVAFETYEELASARPDAVDDAMDRLETHLAAEDADRRRRGALTAGVLVEQHPEAFGDIVPELRSIGDDPTAAGREPAVLALAKLALERPADAAPAVETLLAMCGDPISPPGDSSTGPGAPRAGPGPGGTPKQVRERRDDVRVHAAAGLTRIAAEDPDAVRESVDRLAALLDDDHRLVRAAACEVLEAVSVPFPGDVAPFASDLATLAASDPEHPVPWRAADALVALLDERSDDVGAAVAQVAEDLSTFLRSRNAERRAVGASLLVAAANVRPEAVEPLAPTLRELLDDDAASVREAASLALGAAGENDAVAALAELAEDDSDAAVRAAATRSLERLDRGEPTGE